MILLSGLTILVLLLALRRATELLAAFIASVVVWRSAENLPAMIAIAAAAYATTAWLFDLAANRPALRRVSIAIEILAAGALAGGVAAAVAGRHDLSAWWSATASSVTAMVIVARWRSVAC